MWVGGHIISSPCVGVCTLENGICIGCFRTSKQIAEWAFYNDKEREKIVKEIKPTLATADAALIRKVITYYLNNIFPVDKEEQEKLMNIFHRLGRL